MKTDGKYVLRTKNFFFRTLNLGSIVSLGGIAVDARLLDGADSVPQPNLAPATAVEAVSKVAARRQKLKYVRSRIAKNIKKSEIDLLVELEASRFGKSKVAAPDHNPKSKFIVSANLVSISSNGVCYAVDSKQRTLVFRLSQISGYRGEALSDVGLVRGSAVKVVVADGDVVGVNRL